MASQTGIGGIEGMEEEAKKNNINNCGTASNGFTFAQVHSSKQAVEVSVAQNANVVNSRETANRWIINGSASIESLSQTEPSTKTNAVSINVASDYHQIITSNLMWLTATRRNDSRARDLYLDEFSAFFLSRVYPHHFFDRVFLVFRTVEMKSRPSCIVFVFRRLLLSKWNEKPICFFRPKSRIEIHH